MLGARSTTTPRTFAIRFALAVAGSALLAASAQVAVPMVPVPLTLQTLAIPLLVLALGTNLATTATLLYVFEGAVGLPVFAPPHPGIAALGGPTAGFLWGFPVAAYAIGVLLDRGLGASYAARWIAIFAGTALVFVGGVGWLMLGFRLTLGAAFTVGVAPFILGDLLKVSIAAALPSQAARIAARFQI